MRSRISSALRSARIWSAREGVNPTLDCRTVGLWLQLDESQVTNGIGTVRWNQWVSAQMGTHGAAVGS